MNQYSMKRKYNVPNIKILFPNSKWWNDKKSHKYKQIRSTLSNHIINFHNDLITNLSSKRLTPSEESLLKKGLGFVPVLKENSTRTTDNNLDAINNLILNLERKIFFKTNNIPATHHPFKPISSWQPPSTNHDAFLLFTESILNNTANLNPRITNFHFNLSNDEFKSLNNLTADTTITIKPADKGNKICIMDTEEYINKITTDHLSDKTTYEQLPINIITKITNDVNDLITYLHTLYYIDDTTKEFLTLKTTPRTPIFYGLPKLHKTGTPLRPIVSGCDGPTDKLSKYLTHFIQPLAEKTSSYIRDSKHFIQLLQNVDQLPSNTFLITADVTSLYTNIPHNEGIESITYFIDLFRKDLPTYAPPTIIFKIITEFILKNSIFQFLDSFFIQKEGTSMGTRMAPPYANLFMARLEETILKSHCHHLLFWKRFIDDIFFIFQGTREELSSFMNFMNTIHKSIKFTFDISRNNISFLDLLIYRTTNNHLHTTIYRKPTDSSCLLHFNSYHPLHVKESIIYSQALRYNLLITDDTNLQLELYNLTRYLLARKYPLKLINKNISKALLFSQDELLHKPRQRTKNQELIPLTLQYSGTGILTKTIVQNAWNTTIKTNDDLNAILPRPPTTGYRKNKSLKDILISTRTFPI